jgi:acyl dehydratase
MALELEYDRSLYGMEHTAGPFPVTQELILAFTAGTGETNPMFTDPDAAQAAGYSALVAPPTLCTIFVRQIKLPSIDLKFGKHSMHAGQRVQTLAPIIAGDRLSASSHLKDVYAKTGRTGTMVFVVWETTFSNQDGTVVAEVEESFARRE